MKVNILTPLLFFCFGFSQSLLSNQLDTENYPPKLLLHYTVDELQTMEQLYPEKYKSVVYYHLYSYTVLPLADDVEPTIDLTTFDITPYERFRHQTEEITKIDWKKGIKIILVPIDDMEYQLPIHTHNTTVNEDEDYDFEN